MSKLPAIKRTHKVCVICEGYEDTEYFKRLMELGVWSSNYEFTPINVKSASNIPAKFQDAFQNDRYEAILIFCDTDKPPFREYSLIKRKINEFLDSPNAAEKVIIFANPCTMQIILSHFGAVELKNQAKKVNSSEIERLTGVKNYDAHEEQVKAICGRIFRRNYYEMRQRIEKMNNSDTVSGSTNFITFLNFFEQDDTEWISVLKKIIQGC